MGFTVSWDVRKGTDKPVALVPAITAYCRDSAFFMLQRSLEQSFLNTIGVTQEMIKPTGGTENHRMRDSEKVAFEHWTYKYLPQYTFTCTVAENLSDTPPPDTIPRIIEMLRPYYPNVNFEMNVAVENGWGSKQEEHGIKLTGDASVCYAFYWSCYFQRMSAVARREYFRPWTLEDIISDDYDHKRAWARLTTGEESNALHHIWHSAGPISSYGMHSYDRRIEYITKHIQQLAYAKYLPWFDVSELSV